MNREVLEASLAGLVHDIGKIVQRAQEDPSRKAPIEEEGQRGHASWTTHFAQRVMPERYRGIAYHAAYHHAPEKAPSEDQRLAKMVSLADKLSAGERSEADEGRFPKQMVSIFDQISLAEDPEDREDHFLPLAPLALKDEVLFPHHKWEAEETRAAYQQAEGILRDQFGQDQPSLETYLENGLEALRRAAFNVTSAYYYAKPDVSLYDHARMTAAIAACLVDFKTDEIESMLAAVTKAFLVEQQGKDPLKGAGLQKSLTRPVALLVGGDISGVQDFIYSITSKQAAKTLRGRSFYLQLLTEAVLRFLLRELGLPYSSVIYAGGGHFYLLAPLSAEERLGAVQAQITQKFLRHHGTRLYCALGKTEVALGDFKIGTFSEAWKRMHRDVNRAKQQRYRELGDAFYESVFQVRDHGGNQEHTCSVCGEERAGTKSLKDTGETSICPLCSSFSADIGTDLPRADYVVLGLGEEEQDASGSALDVLSSFGMNVSWNGIPPSADRAVVWAFDDQSDLDLPQQEGVPAVYKTQYTVNLIPQKGEEIITFDELQKIEKDMGIKRLGVLRMDVDNLGDIFSTGLGERSTLARLSTLSLQITLFFEGWIKRICEQEPFRGLIYAVYAGGDDVFLIGPWHIMPELAKTISDEFQRYTSHHPDLHISGGMTFIRGKYPVYQAAEDAGKAEAQAKRRTGKNAFSFLDVPFSWDEFEELERSYELLMDIVNRGGPRALLQTLQILAAEKEERTRTNQRLEFGPWMWHGMYQLSRMEEREKQDAVARKIKKVRKSLEGKNYGNLSLWGKAARWAQLRLRNGDQA